MPHYLRTPINSFVRENVSLKTTGGGNAMKDRRRPAQAGIELLKINID